MKTKKAAVTTTITAAAIATHLRCFSIVHLPVFGVEIELPTHTYTHKTYIVHRTSYTQHTHTIEDRVLPINFLTHVTLLHRRMEASTVSATK